MTRLTKDDLLSIIANSRRRQVIEFLDEQPEVTAYDLSVYIACEECGHTEATLPGKVRQRVYVALTQLHLSTLADSGIIEYDTCTKDVERGPNYATAHDIVRAADRVYNGDGGILGRLRGFGGGVADA